MHSGRQGIHVLCAGSVARIFHARSDVEIGQARCVDSGLEFNLYRLDPIRLAPLHSVLLSQAQAGSRHSAFMQLWHQRLGHSNARRIALLFSKGMTADGTKPHDRSLSTHQLYTNEDMTADGTAPLDRSLSTHQLYITEGKTADGTVPLDRRPPAHQLQKDAHQMRTAPSLRQDAPSLRTAHQMQPKGKTADGIAPPDRRPAAHRLLQYNEGRTADGYEPLDRRPPAHQLQKDAHQLRTAPSLRQDAPSLRAAHQLQSSDSHCDSCAVCKHHAVATRHSVPDESRAQHPLETVHVDLRGPHKPGLHRELYQLLIVDECTHYVVSFVLQRKSDALACFERFASAANNFHGAKGYSLQFMRSDNGTEFVGEDWTPLLTRLGIQRQLTAPYTPHQNGVVERLNRTVAESARTMLHAAGLPARFWPAACQTAVYVYNRLPNKATGDSTPYQL